MRYFITLICALFLASCSPKQVVNDPLGYSFMPKYLNLDSIGPKVPSDPTVIIDTTFKDFKTIGVRSGIHYFKNESNKADSIVLPSGLLLSPYKGAYYVFYEAEYKRMKTQLYYTDYLNKQYYDKSIAAEKLYQDEIVRLRKEAQRSWLEQNSIYLGFIFGIATAVVTEWTVIHVAK